MKKTASKNETLIALGIKKLYDDRILVRLLDQNIKHGLILLPGTATEKAKIGRVIVTGLGNKDQPMLVERGCYVVFGKYEGTEFLWDGKKYIIIRMSSLTMELDPEKINQLIEGEKEIAKKEDK